MIASKRFLIPGFCLFSTSVFTAAIPENIREQAEAIQDEVAAQVVEQVKVSLSVGLIPVARHNPAAYTLQLLRRTLHVCT